MYVKLNKEEMEEMIVIVLWELRRRKSYYEFEDVLTHPNSLLHNAFPLLQDFIDSTEGGQSSSHH